MTSIIYVTPISCGLNDDVLLFRNNSNGIIYMNTHSDKPIIAIGINKSGTSIILPFNEDTRALVRAETIIDDFLAKQYESSGLMLKYVKMNVTTLEYEPAVLPEMCQPRELQPAELKLKAQLSSNLEMVTKTLEKTMLENKKIRSKIFKEYKIEYQHLLSQHKDEMLNFKFESKQEMSSRHRYEKVVLRKKREDKTSELSEMDEWIVSLEERHAYLINKIRRI